MNYDTPGARPGSARCNAQPSDITSRRRWAAGRCGYDNSDISTRIIQRCVGGTYGEGTSRNTILAHQEILTARRDDSVRAGPPLGATP